MQLTVEQRPDGWFVSVADGQERLAAYFSDRTSAQAVAATLAPVRLSAKPAARAKVPSPSFRERRMRAG